MLTSAPSITLRVFLNGDTKAGGDPIGTTKRINFEELEYEDLLDYKKLYQYLKERFLSLPKTSI